MKNRTQFNLVLPFLFCFLGRIDLVFASNSEVKCDFALYNIEDIKPHLGMLLLAKTEAEKQVLRFSLGSGAGGDVVRVIPKDSHNAYIEKSYFDFEVFQNDLHAMNFLNLLFGESSAGNIKVSKVLSVDQKERKVILENSYGLDFRMAMKATEDPAQVDELKKLYYKALRKTYDKIGKALLRKDPTTDQNLRFFKLEFIKLDVIEATQPTMRAVLLQYPRDGSKPIRFRIYLKADNILLQPDGSMTIIDAY